MISSKDKKDTFVRTLFKKVQTSDSVDVRSRGISAESPEILTLNGSMKKFEPDIYQEMNNGAINLYSIETNVREAEISELLTKWILFSSHAKRHGGTFYLYVPEKKKAKAEDILKRKLITCEVESLETLKK